jgi:ribulose-5-phosphate 4-epimerase/fuculose-1-phosphate aldolase
MRGAQPELQHTGDDIEIASLVDLSGRLGRDPLLVQASNGNTSIKLDGVLWIKGSGKWLANAGQEQLLVPIQLAYVEESMKNNREIAQTFAGEEQVFPSIETAMHAVLRHRVVIHVHSVNTLAWAIRLDGAVQLEERLAGLNWRWIPYVSSGIPLAREIAKQVADTPETDVLVLGNHGLVVCGDDCDATEALLYEVERRLAISPRQSPGPDGAILKKIACHSRWRFPDLNSLHSLGTDRVSRRILKGGILYPCQAIFLGSAMPFLSKGVPLPNSRGSLNAGDSAQPFVVVEEGGVMVDENITNAEIANLMGLMQVIRRIEEFAPIRYLKAAEVRSVLSNRAHGYKAVAIRSEMVSNSLQRFCGCSFDTKASSADPHTNCATSEHTGRASHGLRGRGGKQLSRSDSFPASRK